MELEIFSAVATIISAIATVVAAIATARAAMASRAAVDEAKKSNEISIKEINKRERPVLDLPTKHISAKLESNFFSQWEDGDPNHKIIDASDFYLDLYNISDTTARDVVMTFDANHTNEELKKLFGSEEWYFKEGHNVRYLNSGDSSELEFWDEDNNKVIKLTIDNISETLGSIYPIKYNSESTHVHLPLYFTYLISFISNDVKINKNEKKISLLLTLSYSNPSNTKRYIQKIRLKPRIIQSVTDSEVSFTGRLVSEEVSKEELRMAE
ncbi:hypothetical protein KM911_14980 [Bacillus paralicheniformis]|uniref:hypothetical protein n=1 Tax=Bacillus TaxID=1386 RepID=UPI001C21380C|nr:hypothetical protein [Bacillus paralicheniformis]MBU8583008.1 hypothetical protein [Bacillus paralicheniformis]